VARSVLMLELNELCPPLLDRFISEGHLPNLARLRDESLAYTTEAEETQGHLDPWIQWITVHTGASFEEHGIFKLGEGARLRRPTVADLVAQDDRDVWLCGPMNLVPTQAVRGWWLPDPWNPSSAPHPPDLADFAAFVRANVQEHSNASARFPLGSAMRFTVFMLRHGLSAATVWATVCQLAGERTGRTPRWRRAALLDRFQWDMFRHHLRRARPAFSTYFSNTTAHYQHVFWRHMDPDAFSVRPSDAEREHYGGAVLSGYREMDRLVGEAMAEVGRGGTLMLCTALSQQPYTLMEESGGKHIYRPHRVADLLRRLGVVGDPRVAPVMAEQFHLFFDDEAAAEAARERLAQARVGGQPAFQLRRAGDDVFFGCALVHDVPEDAVIELPGGVPLPFYEHLYRSETAKSGYHHPEGALWIRTPDRRGEIVEQRVPLRSVAPTLLRLLDLDPAPTMTAAPLPTTLDELAREELPVAVPT
jgi:hypothetical protein